MSSHAVTAQSAALGSVMDARAENMRQHRLIVNTTPECDSLAEYIARLLHHKVPAEEVADMATLIRKIAESNAAEGQCEMQAGGILDDLTRLTRSAELHGALNRALTVKSIARKVRAPLAVIADPCGVDPLAFVAAVRAVDDVIAACPAAQLRSASLRHELRDRAFNLLGQMVDQRQSSHRTEAAS